ncbi:MAG: S8 family serine peptidase [Planctomycetes bacterium]|nr:S8 family serine peptidase [Planctomycetota bacterium]
MIGKASLLDRAQTAAQVVWSPGAIAGLVLSGVLLSSSAEAVEHHYVLRDGTKVPIVYSQTEIGIILRRDVEAKSARTRLKSACDGELVNVLAAPDSRFKLLRVTKATAKRRELAGQDRAVRTVGKVFRFAGSPGPALAFGQIVVKLRADLSQEERQAVWSDYGLTKLQPFEGLADVYTGVVGVDEDEVLRAERLADDERTVWAHPDLIQMVRPHQVIPTDPLFDQQWHLNNTGQLSDSVVDADIDALEAWPIAKGDGVLFSMFDDSCDVDHEDLRDRYIGIGQDVSLSTNHPDFNNPRPKQLSDFHGTAVMGLAVATGNSVGVRGVSFRSNFTVSRGLGEFLPFSAIASAYLFAVAQGVDVHINSWGFIFPVPNPPILEAAIETAFLQGRDLDGDGADPLGMVIFFASGNGDFFTGIGKENESGLALSSLPTVISVGATSDQDTLARFSNFGKNLNFVAPGAADILTVDNQDDTNPGPGMNLGGFLSSPDFGFLIGDVFGFAIPQVDPEGKYNKFFNGTSAACPIAAGIAGLILSVNPAFTATEVRLIMEHTCDKIDAENADYNGITNRSFRYGYGRVNAHRAALAAQDRVIHM